MSEKVKSQTIVDSSSYTWNTIFKAPPNGLSVPLEPSRGCLLDQNTCKKETADRATNFFPVLTARNSWDTIALPNFRSLPNWHFIQNDIIKKSNNKQEFDTNAIANPNANFNVKVYSLSYQNGSKLPPEFNGVIIPKWLDKSKPISFLIYFEHQPGQSKNTPFYHHFNPLGYDWMFFQIYSYVNYVVKNNGITSIVDMPILSSAISSFGLAYQLEQAQKQYVIILPHINREFSSNGKLRDYQFYSAEKVRDFISFVKTEILGPDDTSPLIASMACFSSGCTLLTSFIMDNLKSNNPIVQQFMKDELNEFLVFDPAQHKNLDIETVNALVAWHTNPIIKSSSKNKCIRFYGQKYYNQFKALGYTNNEPKEANFFKSNDNKIAIAYLPFQGNNGSKIWQNTYDTTFPTQPNNMANWNPCEKWYYVHHQIPALFLTDALRRSLIV